MKVVLYSTHCPKCLILEKKLKQNNIQYKEVNDVDQMIKTGFMQTPILEVDEKRMNYAESIKWVNNFKKEIIN